ncbi:MAG: PIN domain-containing protein [Oscillospiraceae bacterium]|jgi:tRNA(fMet)-specific endonuclease VapC|nr:PIN domain-containing protein [Oscillospiraceae bacterium]
MIYALDTNTISFLLRPNHNPEVVQKFNETIKRGDEYVIPPLCYYEVYWHLLRKNATKQLQVFDNLYADSLPNFNMGEKEFLNAAKIKVNWVKRGIPIGKRDADIFIASYCLTNRYTLVTDNTSDFERIDDLRLVNWKK